MATVRPSIYKKGHYNNVSQCKVVRCEYKEVNELVELQERCLVQPHHALSDSRVIIAGGKGVGSREGFDILSELAALLGGCVGATRGAVNAGFADWDMQVGLTGTTVQPDIYFAFGISGAVQHISGISHAKYIIAVNSNQRAPIFRYSDVAVVADWRKTAEALIKYFRKG